MKTIHKDELFQNLKGFLKTRGIDLQEGSYTHRIEQGCGVLADSINLSQKALHRAKEEMDKRLEQVRQAIHEKTAPPAKAPADKPAAAESSEAKVAARKARSRPIKKRRIAPQKK